MKDKMNYDSFQEVMDAATREAFSIKLKVGKRDVLMTHGGLTSSIAQQFHDAVRKENERQESEANTTASGKRSVHGDSERESGANDQYRGGATSIEAQGKESEEGLSFTQLIQERYNRQLELVEYLDAQAKAIKQDLDKEMAELARINAALGAVGVKDD